MLFFPSYFKYINKEAVRFAKINVTFMKCAINVQCNSLSSYKCIINVFIRKVNITINANDLWT